MTTEAISPSTDTFPATLVRAQRDFPDIWGPERESTGPGRRWLRERMAILGVGSLGNRFADPRGEYTETYAARSLVGALVELWAADVPDEATLAAAGRVHQSRWDAPYEPEQLPSSSLELFVWGLAVQPNRCGIDLRQTDTRTWLRRSPGLRTPFSKARVGRELTTRVVEGDGPRSRVATQAIGRFVYDHDEGFDGIVYTSRHGSREDAYALFDKVVLCLLSKRALQRDEPEAVEAARRLGLYIEEADA